MKLYIAGKVSKNSVFGTHHWREKFCKDLEKRTDMSFDLLDPLQLEFENKALMTPWDIFARDCQLIADCELFIVFLSDDISVGGSQEILIAKHFEKTVIGYAPYNGKFNNARREVFNEVVNNYKDPFVFSTCDTICGTIEELVEATKNYKYLKKESFEKLMIRAIKGSDNEAS